MHAIKIGKLQGKIEGLLNRLIADNYEVGAQAAIYFEGELIVDVACGSMSSQNNDKILSDTLFPVCSTSKGIIATLASILAMRGELCFDQTVASYWPEYAVNGKDGTTVRQAISHQAGIPQRGVFDSYEKLCDWNAACNVIANLSPLWEPGTTAQYHSLNWGWLIGGILERSSGKRLRELLADEITRPLSIDKEIYFGTDTEAEIRVTRFEEHPATQAQCTTAMAETTEIPGSIMTFVNREDVMRACVPAANGMMSARAIAKVYAAMISEVDGIRLFNDKALKEATELNTSPNILPKCFGHGMGLGYTLKGPVNNPGAFFGHGGAGGSEGMAIPSLGLSFGFTKNRFDTHINAPSHTHWLIIREIMNTFGEHYDGGFYR